MPTPFMHLHMARQLIGRLDGRMADCVHRYWPAFLLGSIAPDFQVISDIPREETHFYPIPPAADDYGAFARLLERYPALWVEALAGDQAVFTAAYGIHLLFDLLWDHRVLTPRFRHAAWGDPRQRYTAHNTLLTFLDRQALAQLSPGMAGRLMAIDAAGRLPFDGRNDLVRWQQMIAAQLLPGAEVQTVVIYADRMGMSPEAFAAQLDDEVWMEAHVFNRVSPDTVEAALAEIIPRGIDLAAAYLGPVLARNQAAAC